MLVELMVVVAISAIIGMSLFMVFRMGEEQTRVTDLRMTIQDSGREGLYKMLQEIRMSAPDRITVAADGNSVTFGIPDRNVALNADYSINWDNPHVIQYALGGVNNRQLIRTNQTTLTQTVIANDVVQVQFAGNSATNPTVITVTMSVQKMLPNGRVVPVTPLQIEGVAELRNRVTT